MMRTAYAQTEDILKSHYDKLELVAETLIKDEKITGDEFKQLMENGFIKEEKIEEEKSEISETQAFETEQNETTEVEENNCADNE